MIARLKLWLAVAGAVIVALAASWLGGRKSAMAGIKAKQTEADLTGSLRAEEIENEVEALTDDDLKRRARKWVRNPS
jgi:hypothetical protein